MQFDEKVLAALDVLTEAAENDFELYRICTLVRDLVSPPQVEVIDEKHQRFNGEVFYKDKGGYYANHIRLHKVVWEYYHGEFPKGKGEGGFEIHHHNENKDDNNLSNLELKTATDHRILHGATKHTKTFICEHCGKKYRAVDSGNNKFCSEKCRNAGRSAAQYETITCKQCGKKVRKLKKLHAKFCSTECYFAWKTAHKKVKQPPVAREGKCKRCGKEFTTTDRRKVFCSSRCATLYNERLRNLAKKNGNDAGVDN